jgi:hypothetical protein
MEMPRFMHVACRQKDAYTMLKILLLGIDQILHHNVKYQSVESMAPANACRRRLNRIRHSTRNLASLSPKKEYRNGNKSRVPLNAKHQYQTHDESEQRHGPMVVNEFRAPIRRLECG